MNCPACNACSDVKDSRPMDGGVAVRRRRQCMTCRHRFTTVEIFVPEDELTATGGARAEGGRPPFGAGRIREYLALLMDLPIEDRAAVLSIARRYSASARPAVAA